VEVYSHEIVCAIIKSHPFTLGPSIFGSACEITILLRTRCSGGRERYRDLPDFRAFFTGFTD